LKQDHGPKKTVTGSLSLWYARFARLVKGGLYKDGRVQKAKTTKARGGCSARCQMCKAELGDDLEGRSSYSCNHMPVDNQAKKGQTERDGKLCLILHMKLIDAKCELAPPFFARHYWQQAAT
jgi:hypothetical protein